MLKLWQGFEPAKNPKYTNAVKLIPTREKSKNIGKLEATNEVFVLDFLDDLVVLMNERDIGDTTKLVFECTPKVWSIIKQAYRDLDTDNSAMIAGRRCGRYNDILIVKTNNAIVDVNGNTNRILLLKNTRSNSVL